jgi:hypothetical protein
LIRQGARATISPRAAATSAARSIFFMAKIMVDQRLARAAPPVSLA